MMNSIMTPQIDPALPMLSGVIQVKIAARGALSCHQTETVISQPDSESRVKARVQILRATIMIKSRSLQRKTVFHKPTDDDGHWNFL